MSGSGGRKLSPAAARNLGQSRESWCAVENKKEESWCRAERKHDPQQFSSSVFEQHNPGYKSRCDFQVNAPTHKERKHFQERYECQIKI